MITKEQAFGMYIGQKVTGINTYMDKPVIGYLYSVSKERVGINLIDSFFNIDLQYYNLFNCKLILRPFESITDEEEKEFYNKTGLGIWKLHRYITGFSESGTISVDEMAVCNEYLISIGIDVFNLKERGWAVYESEVEK